MKIYVTSDTHLNHKKLIEWGRPPDFEKRLIQSHSRMASEDYLIHLGDFCIGEDERMHNIWFSALGHVQKRILVRGNHDKKSNGWYLSHGWSAVADQVVMKLFGKRVVFSHIPVQRALWGATDYNIHGHTHGNSHRDFEVKDYYDTLYHREVAMELTNYRPILLTDKFLEGRNEKDHKSI